MRRLILLLAFLAASALPARATFTLVQKPSSSCSSCTSATLTLTQNTGAGHLLVIFSGGTNGTGGDISSSTPPSAGGTWVIGTSCHATNGTVFGESSCAWVLSSTSGVGSITITFTASNNYRFGLLEYSFTGSSVSLDTGNTSTHTSNTTSQVGPNLTLTGTNDVIINGVVMTATATITSISAPYTIEISDTGSSQSMGAADSLNTTTGTGPTWTTGSSSSICFAVAFKETGSSKPPGQIPRVLS